MKIRPIVTILHLFASIWSILTLKCILNKKELAVNTWFDVFIQMLPLFKVHFVQL